MATIVWFKDITKADVNLAGGKGANLGEMLRAGLPVPNGFIITAETYNKFLDTTGIRDEINEILKNLDTNNTDELNAAAKTVKSIITNSKIPPNVEKEIAAAYEKMSGSTIRIAGTNIESGEYVAVRSSATAEDLPDASFAGQQKTFLNVKGKTDLVNAVRECWASL